MGAIRWEISQSMWDFLGTLPEADRDRILDIVAQQMHSHAHELCEYITRFVARTMNDTMSLTGSSFPDTVPPSWLNE